MMQKAIVTGAYGAIGKAIARGIAAKGYDLYIAGRDEGALKKCREELIRETGSNHISCLTADLSQKHEVKTLSGKWNGPLHLLINNAATTPRLRQETPQGIELQFATNVLGYFWMIRFFSDYMKGLDDARIVNVASYWAGDLDIRDMEFKTRRYHNDTAYRQSKQANRMLTMAFAERLKEHGVSVLAAHPGDVSSKLSNNLGYGGWETPEEGAATPLFCATDPILKGVSGKYFADKQEEPCTFSRDKAVVDQLYDVCMQY
ncbi:MAG: SDR family NAD(P)-dependent oxidoreductase [Bacteroidia bacterium]|nr:MAG: SDR family NAD(P)-dependent oxidoreductase [Bacteroidia bacterium]